MGNSHRIESNQFSSSQTEWSPSGKDGVNLNLNTPSSRETRPTYLQKSTDALDEVDLRRSHKIYSIPCGERNAVR